MFMKQFSNGVLNMGAPGSHQYLIHLRTFLNRTCLAVQIFSLKQPTMSKITVKDGTKIYYKDWGKGQPIVFHHGWPLSSDDWDAQMLYFLSQGYRVIAHDRRGHGRSSQTDKGNDMDTYADDLGQLAKHLDLRDAIHVGRSTGGGEAAHNVARAGQ